MTAGEEEQLEKVKILMLSHPLSNFEIQNYYKNEHKFSVFIQEKIYLK